MVTRTPDEILKDLTAARESRRAALLAQSYSTNSGQSTKTVTRASLQQIDATIRSLESEYEEALCGNGLVSVRFTPHNGGVR